MRALGPISVILATLTIPMLAQRQADLTNTSLEDLMNIKVTSASKTEKKLSQTAAAMFVITTEDIRRSGVTRIPDLLRMVPGFDVAQINANTWAVTARGFNGRFANELLVLVDGRTVYTPTFGGVYWDTLDVPMEDIERIEVVRGPGATIWGANAVNGVVNIITKKSSETRGGMVVAGGGSGNESGSIMAQYGGSAGKDTDYRVYSNYFNENGFTNPAGLTGLDAWHLARVGFRSDTSFSSKDTLTIHADLYNGTEQGILQLASIASPAIQNLNAPIGLSGGFVQTVWNHRSSSRSDTTLELSYDHYERDDVVAERRGTLTMDFQNHLSLGESHDLVWGFNYARSSSHTTGNFAVALDPNILTTQIFGAFVQDTIALAPEKLYLTVGAKLEHNRYTGLGLMPTARLAWMASPRHTLWTAVSRALRTPGAIDTSIRYDFGGFTGPGGVPGIVRIAGNPDIQDERVIAYEIGYRAEIGGRLSFDLASFFNRYSNQRTLEPLAPYLQSTPAPPHLIAAQTFQNLMHGETHGLGAFGNWKVTERWTISPGYTFQQTHMRLDPASQDTGTVATVQGSSPKHSAQLRSHFGLSQHLGWDTTVYYVGRLTSLSVPSYTRLDTGLTWQGGKGISFSLFGQNLLKAQHLEFVDITGDAISTLIRRGATARLVWTF